MAEQNMTVWQRLSQTFGPNSLLNQDYPTFKFDKKELLRTKSREEFEKEKLQAQQTYYLTNQWAKVENNLYSQAIYYEPTRLSAQYDYESMEYTPEISAALDIYAEESTTTNEDGFILQIYSESKRIKGVLADLFNNALDINTNLPMWTRNTCKYGDNFVYLKLDPEKGIVGVQQLPTIEIERHEVGASGKISTDVKQEVDKDKKALNFTWKNKNMEFQSWEIAHFRLLGDDRKLPYGTSMLEKARRIWKQLLLSEDAMLIYRTSRAPERRMFKVFVGNMNDDDVEAYVQRVANKFKREQVVDNKTGNVDMRFNQMAVDQDYFIPVRDPAAPDPITTLPGATNLSEIADIEYIQKKLLTALRVPKAFLGFEEVVGDGKNLALQDIRFARTINRIQKSMIAELNKIAIVHLFLLGFEDELSNFTIGLTNPSTQADLLKIDVWKEKVLLYKDLVADPGNGIQATSSTWAKKHIFGWSDDEVRLDLQQQRVERAVGEELKATPTVITKTGLFDNIDKLYGSQTGATPTAGAATTTDDSEELGSPPSFGGGEIPGGEPDLPPVDAAPEAAAPTELTPESRRKDLNILVENNLIEGSEMIYLFEKELMTFGTIKSLIEKNLLESYKNEMEFKKTLREFKHNVLNNKSMSKAYAIYDQLSTPQGLSEQDAKYFIEEGVSLLNNILPSIKLPKTLSEKIENKYSEIDTLVYSHGVNLLERVNAKKNIIQVISSSKESIKESINIPVISMVTVANQTLNNY